MATLSQKSFAGGELTPSLYARTDIAKYVTALRTCRNYTVLKHGGARARSGTEFIGEVKDSSKAIRLIPFNFSLSENYILELGDLYIRFIKNGSYIYESTKAITAITQADPGVVTSTSHGYSNGDEIQINDVVGMTEINGRNFKVNNVTANTFELQDLDGVDFDTSGLTAYSSGGTAKRIYEIVSIWTEAQLFDINYVQNADVLTVVGDGISSRDIIRTSDTSWTANTSRGILYNSTAGSPVPSVTGGAGSVAEWIVGALDADGRERVGGVIAGADSAPSGGSPRTVSWSSVSNAISYRVYRRDNGAKSSVGIWGLVGEVVESGSNFFIDDGVTQDFTEQPAEANFEIPATAPVTATYYQQRFIIGSGETILGSSIGDYTNFFNSYNPIASDQPFSFSIVGRQISNVRHLLDLNGLVIFTESSEIEARGDAAGVLTPTDVNLRTQSYHGSGNLAPIVIDNVALFVQARGSIVRDFSYSDGSNGFLGNDLSIFSTHLFEGYTLLDWTFQKVNNSTVWAVRDDGVLLGLTYLREHEVLAWHRHDFDGGVVESVSTMPEGDEDFLYVLVKRTIDGVTRRYVEKLSTSQIDDIVDVKRMDSFKTYDGRNITATTMTMSGGTTWAYDETITLTASASYFDSTDVGKEIHITGDDGTVIKFNIQGYSSATVVTGKPQKTVPVAMRSVAFTVWSKAIKVVTGLWHLEGKAVSSFSDGLVTSSPNNASYDIITVTDGSITLDDHHSVIHVGLPYISDIETLNVDSSQGETAMDKRHIVSQVNLFVEDSRGFWIGAKPPSDDSVDPLENLYELKIRDSEPMDSPIDLKTEVVNVKIKSEWNSNGRVFIRQVDPVPSTILSIMPEGNFTFRG